MQAKWSKYWARGHPKSAHSVHFDGLSYNTQKQCLDEPLNTPTEIAEKHGAERYFQSNPG